MVLALLACVYVWPCLLAHAGEVVFELVAVGLFVVDEAIASTPGGQGFRPDYGRIAQIRQTRPS